MTHTETLKAILDELGKIASSLQKIEMRTPLSQAEIFLRKREIMDQQRLLQDKKE